MKIFIVLCSLRKSRKLQLNLDIPETFSSLRIYPLLLIPIVENAFKFVGGDNRISIRLRTNGKILYFRSVNSLGADFIKQSNNGLGLNNLRRRLSILYPGNNHHLTTTRSENEYSAEMRLSLQTDNSKS